MADTSIFDLGFDKNLNISISGITSPMVFDTFQTSQNIAAAAGTLGGFTIGAAAIKAKNLEITGQGNITANNIFYNPHSFVSQMQSGVNGLTTNHAWAMTSHGRYMLMQPPATANTWNVWDSFLDLVPNYKRANSYTRSALTITPTVNTVVFSGESEYVLAFDAAGTLAFRYNPDGQGETACSFVGTNPTTGVHRIGYHKGLGLIYIQDGANLASQSIKRYSFFETVLTYVDSITLDIAPANAGTRNMWIGDNYLVFGDAFTNSSLVTYQRYGRVSGVQTTSFTWGHGTTAVTFLGNAIRHDDNAFLFLTEMSNEATGMSIVQRIFPDV